MAPVLMNRLDDAGNRSIRIPSTLSHSRHVKSKSRLKSKAKTNPLAARPQSGFPLPPHVPPHVGESGLKQLRLITGTGVFTDDEFAGAAIASLHSPSASCTTISQTHPPVAPPDAIANVHEAHDEGIYSFFTGIDALSHFETSTEEFQLTKPDMIATAPAPVIQETPGPNLSSRRLSWLQPSTSRASSPPNTGGRGGANSPTTTVTTPLVRRSSEKKTKRPLSGFFGRSSPVPPLPALETITQHLPHNTPVVPRLESGTEKLDDGTTNPILEALDALNGISPSSTPSNTHRLSSLPPLNTNVPRKKSRRTLSGFFSAGSGASSPTTPKKSQEPPRSSTVSLALISSKEQLQSFPSPERLSSLANSPDKRRRSCDKLSTYKKRDELSCAFKVLDADYQRSVGKSFSVKATIIRASLLPFFRTATLNQRIRPEDLEKRVVILSKWWAGLLEMIHGPGSQSMSGTDRATVLDGILGIMERPEWRAAPSDYAPILDRRSNSLSSFTQSASRDSTSSDFLGESIRHKIRNLFTQNLLNQMEFVVEKMGMKSTPASVVAFCGKTCAFAFFFCPGMAKFLVSLWKVGMALMRRILDEAGVPRHSVMGDVSRRISASFPSHLQELRLISLTEVVRGLQHAPIPPLRTEHYNWTGPWLSRWQGSESDLFFTFFKNYHLLASDFLPTHSNKVERMCAPGLLMVHAQLLTTLDATIHRNSTQSDEAKSTLTATFDDYRNEPDASATTLPVAPSNANRLMAENRIVLLLRDCLSENGFSQPETKHFTAECLSAILQAAAKKTSLFDQNACYTLCDFLEQAIAIFARYDHSTLREDVFDWKFWIDVWRRMTDSEHTTLEIRLYSLIYSVWPAVCADAERKSEVCNNFLIEPDFFMTRFNHWCPMVRCYYMRLLSWRIGRYDAGDPPSNTRILATLMERLSIQWSYFLWTKQIPGTNVPCDYLATPCPPAPGRRLLIIRTDHTSDTNGGLYLNFDDPLHSKDTMMSRRRRNSWMNNMLAPVSPTSSDSNESDDGNAPRRWSLLRNVIGASSRTRSRSPQLRTNGSTSPFRSEAGVACAAPRSPAREKPSSDTPQHARHARGRSGSMPAAAAPRAHKTFCFKFSLECVDKRFAIMPTTALSPPRLPLAAQQHLMSRFNLGAMFLDARPTAPPVASCGTYVGRALAEWSAVVSECQSFFDRRMREGVPGQSFVETPVLGVETFKRPG